MDVNDDDGTGDTSILDVHSPRVPQGVDEQTIANLTEVKPPRVSGWQPINFPFVTTAQKTNHDSDDQLDHKELDSQDLSEQHNPPNHPAPSDADLSTPTSSDSAAINRPQSSMDVPRPAALTADQIIDTILHHPTISRQIRAAIAAQLQQRQQELDHAYNERLLELEDYARNWRNTTKEMWMAFQDGKLSVITPQQQDSLTWQGPQHMGTVSGVKLPFTIPNAATGIINALCARTTSLSIRARPFPRTIPMTPSGQEPPLAQAARPLSVESSSQLRCQNWITDMKGYNHNPKTGKLSPSSNALLTLLCSRGISQSIRMAMKVPSSAHLIFRIKRGDEPPIYRAMNKITTRYQHSTFSRHDVVLDYTRSNMVVFGKASCYLRDRRDYLRSEGELPPLRTTRTDAEMSRLYALFSGTPTGPRLRSNPLPPNYAGSDQGLRCSESNSHTSGLRLLIARPTHIDDTISGADFFDVGIEQPTNSTTGAFSLLEDAPNLSELTLLLSFCVAEGMFDVSSALMPSKADVGVSAASETRTVHTQPIQAPLLTDLIFEPPNAQMKVRWDLWIKNIRGTPSDFLYNKSEAKLAMGSSYLRNPAVLSKLIQAARKLWFRSEVSEGVVRFFHLPSQPHSYPIKSPGQPLLEFSEQNIFLLWKALCLLHERKRLLMERFGKSNTILLQKNEWFVKYYHEVLWKRVKANHVTAIEASKKVRKRIATLKQKDGGTTVDCRLLIARPGHSASGTPGVDKKRTEFLDVATVTRTALKQSDIVIPECTTTIVDIFNLLQESMELQMLPVLRDFDDPSGPQKAKGDVDVENQGATAPDQQAEPQTPEHDDRSETQRTLNPGPVRGPPTPQEWLPQALELQIAPSQRVTRSMKRRAEETGQESQVNSNMRVVDNPSPVLRRNTRGRRAAKPTFTPVMMESRKRKSNGVPVQPTIMGICLTDDSSEGEGRNNLEGVSLMDDDDDVNDVVILDKPPEDVQFNSWSRQCLVDPVEDQGRPEKRVKLGDSEHLPQADAFHLPSVPESLQQESGSMSNISEPALTAQTYPPLYIPGHKSGTVVGTSDYNMHPSQLPSFQETPAFRGTTLVPLPSSVHQSASMGREEFGQSPFTDSVRNGSLTALENYHYLPSPSQAQPGAQPGAQNVISGYYQAWTQRQITLDDCGLGSKQPDVPVASEFHVQQQDTPGAFQFGAQQLVNPRTYNFRAQQHVTPVPVPYSGQQHQVFGPVRRDSQQQAIHTPWQFPPQQRATFQPVKMEQHAYMQHGLENAEAAERGEVMGLFEDENGCLVERPWVG